MSEEKLVRFTVSMPEPVRTKLKAQCVLQGVTMNDTIVKLVEQWIKQPEPTASPKRKS
jgi:hypothetical protein